MRLEPPGDLGTCLARVKHIEMVWILAIEVNEIYMYFVLPVPAIFN